MKKIISVIIILTSVVFLYIQSRLGNVEVFSAVLAFLMASLLQWIVTKDKISYWKVILGGVLLILVPIFFVVLFKIPATITNITCVMAVSLWGFTFTFSWIIEPWCYEITRDLSVTIGVFLHLLLFIIFPSSFLVLIYSMTGLVLGLSTIYLWKYFQRLGKHTKTLALI